MSVMLGGRCWMINSASCSRCARCRERVRLSRRMPQYEQFSRQKFDTSTTPRMKTCSPNRLAAISAARSCQLSWSVPVASNMLGSGKKDASDTRQVKSAKIQSANVFELLELATMHNQLTLQRNGRELKSTKDDIQIP